jgi:acyl dehydratase
MAYQTGVFDRAHGYPTGLDKVRFFTPAYERDTLEVDIKALKVASSTGSKSETLLEFTTKKQTGEKVLSFNFIMAYSKRSLKPGRRS